MDIDTRDLIAAGAGLAAVYISERVASGTVTAAALGASVAIAVKSMMQHGVKDSMTCAAIGGGGGALYHVMKGI